MKPKPCPFCGVELKEKFSAVLGVSEFYHKWNGCYLSYATIEDHQVKKWNKRKGEKR